MKVLSFINMIILQMVGQICSHDITMRTLYFFKLLHSKMSFADMKPKVKIAYCTVSTNMTRIFFLRMHLSLVTWNISYFLATNIAIACKFFLME